MCFLSGNAVDLFPFFKKKFILLGLVNSRFELMVFPVNFEMVYRDVLKKNSH